MDPLDLFLQEPVPEKPGALSNGSPDDLLGDLLEEFRTSKDPGETRDAFEVIMSLLKK